MMNHLSQTLSPFITNLDLSKFNDAIHYIHTIKTHFTNDPHKYNSFVQTLMDTTKARISHDGDSVTLQEIQHSDVERIRAELHGHPDLLATLDTFLAPKYLSAHSQIQTERVLSEEEVQTRRRNNIVEELPESRSNADEAYDELSTLGHSFLSNMRGRLTKSSYMDMLRIFCNIGGGRMQNKELEKEVENLEKKGNFRGIARDFKSFMRQFENIVAKHQMQQRHRKRKTWETITPSYVFDPESCESSLESGVLNDRYKCQAPKKWGKLERIVGKKERIMNKIEDELLDLNREIEKLKSAITYAKFLWGEDKTKENSEQENGGGKEQVEGEENVVEEVKEVNKYNRIIFEALFIECLATMKDHAEKLKKNPTTELPKILSKFQNKLRQFQASKEQYDERCRKLYKKHFRSGKK